MNKVDILRQLKLSPAEAKAYLAVLDIGETKLSQIGAMIQTTRMAGYTAAEGLVAKGLFSYSNTGTTKKVVPEDPERLLLRLKEQKERLEDEQNRLKELMPALQTVFATSNIRPRFRAFFGLEGLKTVCEDILKTLKSNGGYVGYGSIGEEFVDLGNYFEDFLPRRVNKNITFKGIVPDEFKRSDWQKVDRVRRRELRYISTARFPFRNEINIYGNKISIVSFRDKIGVIIESKQIAETQRRIFELAWEGAKALEKKR